MPYSTHARPADPKGPTNTDGVPRTGAPAVANAPAGEQSPAPAAQRTILLVDDNDGVRAVARKILARAGYDVLEATDGIDALRKLEATKQPVDVVLSDMVMPGMGGGDLARAVHTRYPAAALVLMSGYAPETLGGHEVLSDTVFLTKPFTPSVLLQGIASALAARSP